MAISYVGAGAITQGWNDGVSVNAPVPSGTAAGDVLLMIYALNDRCTASTPSGWTAIGGYGASIYVGGTYAYYKIASGSEPATYAAPILNEGSSRNFTVGITAFRGVDNTTPINVFNLSPERNATTAPSAADITTTVDNCALVASCVEYNQHIVTITASGGLTLAGNWTTPSPTSATAYVLTTGVAGVYSPGTFSASASNDFRVMTIALAPAAGGDTTAPTLTSPIGTQTGSTTASGTVSTDEGNGTLYYLASTNATETAATVKAASSQAVSGTGSQSVSFIGLTASTTYYAHYCHRDAAGNDSTVSNSASFTTAAASSAHSPAFYQTFIAGR